MIGNTIFREEALARRARQEPLEDLLRVTAPHEWLLVVGLAAALLAFLVWSLLGSVERSVSLDAVLVYGGEHHQVIAPASGMVAAVLVAPGDLIVLGQPLARVFTRAAAAVPAASIPDDASAVEFSMRWSRAWWQRPPRATSSRRSRASTRVSSSPSTWCPGSR